jgi:hypothetical protein
MIHALSYVLRPTRLRTGIMIVFAALAATNCADPAAPNPLSDSPAAPTSAADPTAGTVMDTPTLASVVSNTSPFGPVGLWNTATTVSWGPKPFSFSQNSNNPSNIVTQISAARSMGQRLVLALSASNTNNVTNGKFDITKWKNHINAYNTTAIRNAIAAGVSDGTIIGNMLLDEPETKRWGGNIDKRVIDQLASFAKNIFPTLPQGINHGPPGYKWHTDQTYKVLDYVLYQYNWWVTTGDVNGWRSTVLARAKADGVRPALSLNVLDGGVQDRSGTWDCSGSGQAGKGTYAPNCRMTPDQMTSWGKALVGYGCFLMLWKYDGVYMRKSSNQTAFSQLASAAASKPRQSCKRP